MSDPLGFIGLGRMGTAMAGRLLDAGRSLTVYNRSPDKTDGLVERGTTRADSPASVAARSGLVISMVADDPALLDVALGEHGVLAGARPGLLYVDMSTVSPAASARVAAACDAAGVGYLRAPVTGSVALAQAGTIGILASGPRDRYEQALETFRLLGQQCFYLGPGEEARVMKLALNMVIGVTMASLAEALVLGEKAGLDWDQMLDVFCNSAITSPFVKYKAGPLARRDFTPAMTTRLLSKDFALALGAARELGVAAPIAGLIQQLLQATTGHGWGERDFSALLLLAEQAAGLEPTEGIGLRTTGDTPEPTPSPSRGSG